MPNYNYFIAEVLDEFYGTCCEKRGRIVFVTMATGRVVPCIVSHELGDTPMRNPDLVVIETDKPLLEITHKSFHRIVDIIKN